MPASYFLRVRQQEALARAIDAKFNIPVIRDTLEFAVWLKMVQAVDRVMADRVPDEILDTLNDRNLQLETMIAEALQDNLTLMLCDLLAVPFLPTVVKKEIIDWLIVLLVQSMASATTIDEQIEAFLLVEA